MSAVFLKEIRILLRSRKAFWMLLTTLLLVGGTLGLQWVNSMHGDFALNYRATLGREFFIFVATAQLIVMGLTSALMSASAITSEREAGTLELLLATGLPRPRLLLGKWLSAIFFQLLVAVGLLPILALVFQLGGVGGDELLFAAAMTALTVMTYAMVGVAASCKKRKTSSALHATLSQILLYVIVIPMGVGIVAGGLGVGRPAPSTSIFSISLVDLIFWSTSPLMTWVYHLEAFPRAASGMPLASPVFLGHVIFQSLVFGFALHRACRALRRRQAESEAAPPPGMAPAGDIPANWPVPPRTEPRPLTRLIEDHQNPVTLKEFNNWMENRTYALTGSIALCLILSLILIFAAMAGDYRDSMRALGATITILLMIVLPAFTAPAFSREREERTLDLLRATPFTSRQLVAAKARAALRVTVLFFAALAAVPVVVRLLALFADREKIQHWSRDGLLPNLLGPTLLFALPVFAFAWLFIAIGIYCSSRQRRTMAALLQTYLVLFLLAFLPVPLELGLSLLGLSGPAEIVMRATESIMPVFNCFHYFLGGGDRKSSLLCLASSDHFAGLVLWMVVHAAAVLLLAFFILRAAARRLEKEGQA